MQVMCTQQVKEDPSCDAWEEINMLHHVMDNRRVAGADVRGTQTTNSVHSAAGPQPHNIISGAISSRRGQDLAATIFGPHARFEGEKSRSKGNTNRVRPSCERKAG